MQPPAPAPVGGGGGARGGIGGARRELHGNCHSMGMSGWFHSGRVHALLRDSF